MRKALQLSDIVITDESVKEGSLVGRERRVHGSSAKYLSPNDETGLIYTWVDTAKAGAGSESPQIILVSACDKMGSSRVVRWRRISPCKDFATVRGGFFRLAGRRGEDVLMGEDGRFRNRAGCFGDDSAGSAGER